MGDSQRLRRYWPTAGPHPHSPASESNPSMCGNDNQVIAPQSPVDSQINHRCVTRSHGETTTGVSTRGAMMNIGTAAVRAITKTADVTTATAGAVGGAVVNGVIGGLQGTAAGIRSGLNNGSQSTPAAAFTLAALGTAGLVEWPVLAVVGGTALVVHQLNRRSDGSRSAPADPAPVTAPPRKAAPRKATPRKATPRKASPRKASPRKATASRRATSK
jgi:hypothetical protein